MSWATLATRIAYSLRMFVRHRHAVAALCQQGVDEARQLVPEQLYQRGIRVLILDFDGVLAPHADPYPLPCLHPWILDCLRVFGTAQVFVLSNKPMPIRIAHFAATYPGLRWVQAARKKPYPDGLQQVLAETGVPAPQVLLLDDRLLTGMLACCLAGTQGIYIRRPYVNWRHNPIREWFFMTLRGLERAGAWWFAV